MNKTIKAGILVAILVVPASIFLFLKFFGANRFDLPYYMPRINDQGEALIQNGDTVFHQVPKFRLIDQAGVSFDSDSVLSGNLYVVSFFFSRCGTICPVITRNQKMIQEGTKGIEGVRLVSISIDPKFDTPEVLGTYAGKIGADTARWSFLTGEKGYIYDLAIRGYKLPVADASAYDASITDPDQTFIHSEKLLLIDGNGYIRGIYDGTEKSEIKRAIVEIKVLLDGKNEAI